MQVVDALWRRAKRSRVIPLGPVSMVFRLRRAPPLSGNRRRRIVLGFRRWIGWRYPTYRRLTEPAALPMCAMEKRNAALIVGVGPGLGEALACRFAGEGFDVALASRNATRLHPLVQQLHDGSSRSVRAYACDASQEGSVASLFRSMVNDMDMPDIVVYSLQSFARAKALDVEVSTLEDDWRQNCLGAFIVAREAGRRMVERGHGTIVLVGSTSGIVARPDHLSLAVGKFGLRALAHVLARELGPLGVHVVHLVIDGDIKEDELHGLHVPQLEPSHLASLICSLHDQPRSAWTCELDVRPYNEKFWEHC